MPTDANRGQAPAVEIAPQKALVWDETLRKWLPAQRVDLIVPREVIEIKWTNTGVNTDVSPDEDKQIDVRYARRIAIQVDSTADGNTSTDIDVNVEASPDQSHWDSTPYAERNIGDAEIKTFLVEPWSAWIRLRLDNNEAATTAYVTSRILVVE